MSCIKPGENAGLSICHEFGKAVAADMLNVGERSVRNAVVVRNKGTPPEAAHGSGDGDWT